MRHFIYLSESTSLLSNSGRSFLLDVLNKMLVFAICIDFEYARDSLNLTVVRSHYNYDCVIKSLSKNTYLAVCFCGHGFAFLMIRNDFVLLTLNYRASLEVYRAKFEV